MYDDDISSGSHILGRVSAIQSAKQKAAELVLGKRTTTIKAPLGCLFHRHPPPGQPVFQIVDEVRFTVLVLSIVGSICVISFLVADFIAERVSFHQIYTQDSHGVAIIVGGVFSLTAVILSFYQIYSHKRHYTHPPSQKLVIRILWMVPIYAISAWLSLTFLDWSSYIDFVRGVYEAYVIYSFMILLTKYLGGHNGVVEWMKYKLPQPWPEPLCCLKKVQPDSRYLYHLKYGALQYAILQPITAVAAVVLTKFGVYEDGVISATNGYPYIAFVVNCWGKGTEFLLYDGRILKIEEIIKLFKSGHPPQLMGDDNTPRNIIGITEGHTGDDQQRVLDGVGNNAAVDLPAMYRITSINEGRNAWECNGSHILVLISYYAKPEGLKQNGMKWSYYRYTINLQTNLAIVECPSFTDEDLAREQYSKDCAAWKPIIWEVEAQKYYKWLEENKEYIEIFSWMMYQPDTIQFAHPDITLEKRIKRQWNGLVEGNQRITREEKKGEEGKRDNQVDDTQENDEFNPMLSAELRDVSEVSPVPGCTSPSSSSSCSSSSYSSPPSLPHASLVQETAWVIGLWLSDGVTGSPYIYQIKTSSSLPMKSHTEVVDRLERWYKAYYQVSDCNITTVYRAANPHHVMANGTVVNSSALYRINLGQEFKNILESYGIYQDKRIPRELLRENYGVRMSLLAGLIDGNGSKHTATTMRYVSCHKKLVQQFVLLCRTLGLRTGKIKEINREEEDDEDDDDAIEEEVIDGHTSTFYSVTLSGRDVVKIPLSLQYKLCQLPPSNVDLGERFNIEKVEHARYYGVTVDGNHRILGGDGVVHHNCSQLVSLYCLVWLYMCLKNELAPFSPLAKFMVVKLVVFATFWQGVGLAIMAHMGWITNTENFSVGEVQVGMQDFLVCIEMFIAACAHKYAFGSETYADGSLRVLMEQRAIYLSEISYKRGVEAQREAQKLANALAEAANPSLKGKLTVEREETDEEAEERRKRMAAAIRQAIDNDTEHDALFDEEEVDWTTGQLPSARPTSTEYDYAYEYELEHQKPEGVDLANYTQQLASTMNIPMEEVENAGEGEKRLRV